MPQDIRDKLQATLGSAYTLEHELRGGAMSRVFVAEDNVLGRKIVVKMLPSDAARIHGEIAVSKPVTSKIRNATANSAVADRRSR